MSYDKENAVFVENPASEEFAMLRQTMAASLLNCVKYNVLFEFEKRRDITSISGWEEYAKEHAPSFIPGYHKREGEESYNYQMRIGGSLAERLFSFYVTHSNLKIYESVVQAEWYE